MIKELISRAFVTRNASHARHWKTNSFAVHKALGSFYEDLVDLLDKYVEAYQGTFGLVENVAEDVENITKHIRDEIVWINKNRSAIAQNVPALENILDDLTALHMKTLYKLENLR